jgi:hypothetical protein
VLFAQLRELKTRFWRPLAGPWAGGAAGAHPADDDLATAPPSAAGRRLRCSGHPAGAVLHVQEPGTAADGGRTPTVACSPIAR